MEKKGIEIKKIVLESEHFNVNALVFLPEVEKHIKPNFALLTHGYTSHKGSILNWPMRLAEEGMPVVLFDLPGHYLGSYNEVKKFEDFTSHAHELFEKAFHSLKNIYLEEFPLNEHFFESLESQIILGGHSLGALLAIKAMKLNCFKSYKRLAACVGFGLPPEGVTHIFNSPFYKSTLKIRGQLVAPAISPDKIFPWIKEEKEALNLTGEEFYFLSGQDDMVVGKDGVERLVKQLEDLGNTVHLEKPTKLPHHLPETAAPHIKKYLKDSGIL